MVGICPSSWILYNMSTVLLYFVMLCLYQVSPDDQMGLKSHLADYDCLSASEVTWLNMGNINQYTM